MHKIFAAVFGAAAIVGVAVLLSYRQEVSFAVPEGLDLMDAPALYQNTCAACHGERGEGRVNLTPPIRGRGLSAGHVKKQIQHGGPKMPAMPFIRGEALERLAEYVAGLK